MKESQAPGMELPSPLRLINPARVVTFDCGPSFSRK